MVFRAKLTQEVILDVEADSEKALWDWLLCTTPDEAAGLAKCECSYGEEIIAQMPDDITPDYRLR